MVVLNGFSNNSEVKIPKFIRSGEKTSSGLKALISKGMVTKDDRERNGRLYASDSCFCARKAVISATKEGENVTSAAMNGYCEIGNTIEDLILNALHRENALIFKQYRLPDFGINLGGKIDGIVLVDGKIRVLEIKSCGDLPKKPKAEHLPQALAYSAITGLPATILYFSRNVADWKEELQIVEFDLENYEDEKRNAIFQSVYADLAIKEGLIPEIPSHLKKSSDCGFCKFKEYCFGEGKIDSKLKNVSPEDHLRLIQATNEFVDHLLSKNVVEDRRNGVFKFLQQMGNSNTREILTSDWNILI